MSDIKKKFDAKQAELIRSQDDRGRGGSSLLAPEDLEDQVAQVLAWMRSPKQINHGTSGKLIRVPRFGLMSLILSKTHVRVYGHPALKRISKTAFTDGVTIFLCEDLLDKTNDDVRKNRTTYGLEWILLHEGMHVMRNHCNRMGKFPADIANEATDLLINTQLDEAFGDIKPCPTILEFALGYKAGDKERWMHLSEPTIAMQLLADRGLNKKRKQEQPPKDGKQGDQQDQGKPGGQSGQGGGQKGPQQPGGQGKPGGQDGSGGQQEDENDPLSNLDDPKGGQGKGQENDGQQGGQPGQSGQGRRGQPGQGGQPGGQQGGGSGGDEEGYEQGDGGEGEGPENDRPDNFGEEGDQHFIDPRELAEILEENGLEGAREKLGLPASNDKEGLNKYAEEGRNKATEAILSAQSDMIRSGGTYPGQHIVSSAIEMVRDFTKGKVKWRLGLQEATLGFGQLWEPHIEEPHDVYYLSSMKHVLGMRPYLPSHAPHKSEDAVLFLIDSSGSMDHQALRAQVSEALELKTASANMGDAAAHVFIWACDTMLRGEPQEINDSNVEEFLAKGLELRGRGGTSIETCINQALSSPLLKDKNIKAIVYGSDLLDNPVPKPSMLEDRPDLKVLFLADPNVSPSDLERFSRGTDWADVYVIDDALTIDMEEVNNGKQVVSPVARKRAKPR